MMASMKDLCACGHSRAFHTAGEGCHKCMCDIFELLTRAIKVKDYGSGVLDYVRETPKEAPDWHLTEDDKNFLKVNRISPK